MRRARQQRQQNATRVLAQQLRFKGDFGGLVGRIDTEDVPFRLQGAAELGRAHVGAAGDDHRLDGRVRQHLFQVGGRGVGRPFVPARGNEGVGHRPAVGVVSQERETHV